MPRPSARQPHPALEDARLAILADYLDLRARRPENRTAAEREAERGLKAVALAPTLKLCRALLAGQHVPLEQLEPDAVARYQLKPEVRL